MKEKKVREWFKKHTWNKTRVVSFLSHSNLDEGAQVNGPKNGHPCVFPFYYPDCSLMRKATACIAKATINRTLYTKCADNEDTPWCSTRTHWNNSHIVGNFKWCSSNYSEERDSQNIASSDFDSLWEEGLYDLGNFASGHCHTYNPGFSSLAGFKGQLFILLGKYLDSKLF